MTIQCSYARTRPEKRQNPDTKERATIRPNSVSSRRYGPLSLLSAPTSAQAAGWFGSSCSNTWIDRKKALFKNFIIGVLVLAVLTLGSALVRVGNQRYALSTGMCPGSAPGLPPDLKCIAKAQTCTGWWWHIFYSLSMP